MCEPTTLQPFRCTLCPTPRRLPVPTPTPHLEIRHRCTHQNHLLRQWYHRPHVRYSNSSEKMPLPQSWCSGRDLYNPRSYPAPSNTTFIIFAPVSTTL